MKENSIILFFRKIHLSVVDAKYLSEQALNAATKSVLSFFALLFLISLAISAVSRTVKITKQAPEILNSAIGTLVFEDYKLISPDTLTAVSGWKLKELGTLVSGIRIPPSVVYPIEITVGTDSIKTVQNQFVHIGKTAFSTNILSSFFSRNSAGAQTVSWDKVLLSPNAVVNADFYKAQFSKGTNKLNIFVAEFAIIGVEMLSAIFQIWLSILIYLLFFGRKMNIAGRIRLILLTTVPYFIIMPVSLAAANGISWTTDIALVGALVMTFRAVSQIDKISAEGKVNEML